MGTTLILKWMNIRKKSKWLLTKPDFPTDLKEVSRGTWIPLTPPNHPPPIFSSSKFSSILGTTFIPYLKVQWLSLTAFTLVVNLCIANLPIHYCLRKSTVSTFSTDHIWCSYSFPKSGSGPSQQYSQSAPFTSSSSSSSTAPRPLSRVLKPVIVSLARLSASNSVIGHCYCTVLCCNL